MPKDSSPEKVRVKDVPRSSDELVLNMIHFKKQGWSWSKIVKRFGKPSAQQLCFNVLKEDIAFSGEPESEVRKAYW